MLGKGKAKPYIAILFIMPVELNTNDEYVAEQ